MKVELDPPVMLSHVSLPVLRPVDPEVGRVEEGCAEGGVGQADDGAGQPEEQEARAHQRHRARHLGVARRDLLTDLVAATAKICLGRYEQ